MIEINCSKEQKKIQKIKNEVEREKRQVDIIAGLLFVIDWLGDYVEDPDNHEKHVEYLFNEKWIEQFLPMKDSEHNGDCTKAPMTCLRCYGDKLYEIAYKVINNLKLELEK
jgi:hypothetical protein